VTGGLDRIDLKILLLLQNSGRLTNAAPAETALPGVRQTWTFFVMKEVVDNAPLDF
jgi:DNA-binding Lrp family transcriptional regulator